MASHSRQDMQKTDRHWELCQEEKCVCAQRVNLNDTYVGMEISYRCNELPARLSVYLSVRLTVFLSVCTSLLRCLCCTVFCCAEV